MAHPRIEEIADNMPGDGGINYFSVHREDLIAALEAAYEQGKSDGLRNSRIVGD